MQFPMFKSTNLSAGYRGFNFKFQRNTPDYGAIALFAGQVLLALAIKEVQHRRELRQYDEVLSLDEADEPDAEPIDEDESA